MTGDRLTRQMEFIVEIGRLKHILRRTLTIHSGRDENDAEHSWHLGVMAILLSAYAGEDVNVLRVVTMVLIHDPGQGLAEAWGEETPGDGARRPYRRELAGPLGLCPGPHRPRRIRRHSFCLPGPALGRRSSLRTMRLRIVRFRE